MAKAIVYIGKIERCREVSATGFRIKQAMYNARRMCHAERTEFPYTDLHRKHCIPGAPDFLEDKAYYLLTDRGFCRSERTISDREKTLRTIAEKCGGKIVFTTEREPVLLVDGWLLHAGQVHDGTKWLDSIAEEDCSVPYELYPRIIDYSDDKTQALVETSQFVCSWQKI